MDPANAVNVRFLQDYGLAISEARDRHKKIAKEVGIEYTEKPKISEEMDIPPGTDILKRAESKETPDFPTKKDYNYALERGIPLLSYDDEGKDSQILVDEISEFENVEYLANNYPNYAQKKISFDDIYVPKDIIRKETLAKKDFVNINNEELQESFDYMQVINQQRAQYRQELKARMVDQNKEDEKKTIGGRAKETIKSIKDRVKGLLGGGKE